MNDRFRLMWYGERGVVNAILVHLQQASDPVASVQRFLSGVQWGDGSRPDWIEHIEAAMLFVEWGWADFGNPDLLLALTVANKIRCVLVEAKVVPYIASMKPNRPDSMREAGFNSSINGQLTLKYRFAKAVERTAPDATVIEESTALLAQYQTKLGEARTIPRRLMKASVVKAIQPILGLPETQWSYVALTWDRGDHAYFSDPPVSQFQGLPCFLSDSGDDLMTTMLPRLGWLGYRELEQALPLRNDRAYVAAFETMQSSVEPDDTDYQVAEANVQGVATPESLGLAEKLRRELFSGFDVVAYKGSYSVRRNGQTVGKIIPRANSVFVGIRETETPSRWFSGPMETVSVQGVRFVGIYVPAEHPETIDAMSLAAGLVK